MTEKEFKDINTAFGIDFIIDKLPLYPRFTKEQMISEAEYFHKFGDIEFAYKIKKAIQNHPDAKIYVHFNKDFYPVSNMDDIVNIPGLLNRLKLRIELDYCEYNENYSDSNQKKGEKYG